MSNTETSGQQPSLNPKSLKRGPNRPGETLAAGFSPDPLLKSGSFIDATAGGFRGAIETPRKGRSSNGASTCLASEKNCAEPAAGTPVPESMDSPGGTQQRRAMGPSPDWLPSGWVVEDRVRSSGASAGTIDRYYFDPDSGHRFRSRKEVLYFLETGTRRKKGKLTESSDTDTMGVEGQKQKNSATKAKSSALNFEFFNVPENVKWVLTDSSQGSWAPFIGEEKVPKATVQEWDSAFTSLTSKRSDHIK